MNDDIELRTMRPFLTDDQIEQAFPFTPQGVAADGGPDYLDPITGADPEDPNADHLANSETVEAIDGQTRRSVAKTRITRAIRAHGPDESTASEPLRNAARRHYGSWRKACILSGLDPLQEGTNV